MWEMMLFRRLINHLIRKIHCFLLSTDWPLRLGGVRLTIQADWLHDIRLVFALNGKTIDMVLVENMQKLRERAKVVRR